MANAFESFVQLELGKRPYTTDSGTEETLLIRRGPGPRQLSYLTIAEGEVLGKIAGKLASVPQQSGGTQSTIAMFTHKQPSASATWTVIHSKACSYFTLTAFDASTRKAVLPDEIEIVDDNTVIISFSMQLAGHATFTFDLSAVA